VSFDEYIRSINAGTDFASDLYSLKSQLPKNMKTLPLVLLLLVAASCSQKNKVASSSEATEVVETQEEMNDALTTGVIHKSDEASACPYTIEVKGLSYRLDPTNLDAAFMKDGMQVKFEFLPLRRQNRCEEANPVEIKSMQEA